MTRWRDLCHWATELSLLQAVDFSPISASTVLPLSFHRDRHPQHLRCQQMANCRQLPYCFLLLPGCCPLQQYVRLQEMEWVERPGDCAHFCAGRGTGAPCVIAASKEVNGVTAEPGRCLGYWQVGTRGLLQDRNTLPEGWLPPPPASLRGREE